MKKLSCSGHIHPFFLLIIIILVAIPMGFYGMYLYIAPSLPEMSSLKKAPLLKPMQVYSADNQPPRKAVVYPTRCNSINRNTIF